MDTHQADIQKVLAKMLESQNKMDDVIGIVTPHVFEAWLKQAPYSQTQLERPTSEMFMAAFMAGFSALLDILNTQGVHKQVDIDKALLEYISAELELDYVPDSPTG